MAGTVRRSRPIAEDFLAHPRYRFKVIVGPHPARQRQRQVAASERPRRLWRVMVFAARRAKLGFEASPEHLQIDKLQVLQFKDKAQRPVTLAQAHVQGQLIVTDRAQFQHSFSHGIGRAGLWLRPAANRPFC